MALVEFRIDNGFATSGSILDRQEDRVAGGAWACRVMTYLAMYALAPWRRAVRSRALYTPMPRSRRCSAPSESRLMPNLRNHRPRSPASSSSRNRTSWSCCWPGCGRSPGKVRSAHRSSETVTLTMHSPWSVSPQHRGQDRRCGGTLASCHARLSAIAAGARCLQRRPAVHALLAGRPLRIALYAGPWHSSGSW